MTPLKHYTLDDLPLTTVEAHFVLEYCSDLNLSRASVACGIDHEEGYNLFQREDIQAHIQRILQNNVKVSDVTADDIMTMLYRLYINCMQNNKQGTALQCIKTMGSLGRVDAYAAEKVEMKDDRDVVQRLIRQRQREHEANEAMKREKASFL